MAAHTPSADPPPDAETTLRRRDVAIAGHNGDATSARAALTDPHPAVRATALGAIARAGDLQPADLVAGLTDPAPTVRRRALEEVAALTDDPDGRADGVSILALLDDPDPIVAEVAAFACGERIPPEPDAAARLADLATGHDDPLVREAAVAALGAIGDPIGLPAILAATTDKPAVRRRAVIALTPFDGPEVDAALARALEDRDWQVRQAAEDLSD